MEIRLLREKAQVKTDTQTEHLWQFCEKRWDDHTTLTLNFQASVRAFVSIEHSFER